MRVSPPLFPWCPAREEMTSPGHDLAWVHRATGKNRRRLVTPSEADNLATKESMMPLGIQQTIQGLMCELCNDTIADRSNESQYVCSQCEDDMVIQCESCLYQGYDLDLLSYVQLVALRNLGLTTLSMAHTSDTDNYLCVDCVHVCSNCDEAYQYEDSMLECCYQSSPHIHYYSYTPRLLFATADDGNLAYTSYAKSGKLYMGVELEVNKMAQHVDRMYDEMRAQHRDFVYFKEDASLGDGGVEIVTHPATLDAFGMLFPFEQLDTARAMGARSYAYHNCGFHIHVSRSAFTATHMWKFIRFQLNNELLCQNVAQRDESMYATWRWDQSESSSVPDYVKGKKSNGRRYLAINFQNPDTVELRYFKGNILPSAILKNVEFVDAMYEFTKSLTVRDVAMGAIKRPDAFLSFIRNNEDRYKNLISYLDNNHNKESN